MMFAVTIAAILVAVGVGVDSSALVSKRTALQDRTDSIALAAALSGLTEQNELQAFVDEYAASLPDFADVTLNLTLDNGSIVLTSSSEQELFILGAFGDDRRNVSALSAVPIGAVSNLNLALVLDTTHSMQGQRIAALRDATNTLLDNLGEMDSETTLVSLVPFSNYVRISTSNAGQPWIDAPEDETRTVSILDRNASTNCENIFVNERRQIVCDVEVRNDTEFVDTWEGCMNSRRDGFNEVADFNSRRLQGFLRGDPCSDFLNNELVPLTNDLDSLKTSVNNLQVGRQTYIPSGLVWGWRTLSPNAPFEEAQGNPEAKNVMILMSDGSNSISLGGEKNFSDGIFHEGESKEDADSLTSRLCNSIKNDEIEIYSIAFEITDASTINLMRNCASSPGHFYDAGNSQALKAAFVDIGNSFGEIRLSR